MIGAANQLLLTCRLHLKGELQTVVRKKISAVFHRFSAKCHKPKRNLLHLYITGLHLIHIQHIIRKGKQCRCRFLYLFYIFQYLCSIRRVAFDDVCHSQNPIDGRANIMRHIMQNLRACCRNLPFCLQLGNLLYRIFISLL